MTIAASRTSLLRAARRLVPLALARPGGWFLGIAISTSLAQSFVDLAVATSLLLFLRSVGLVEAAAIPRWLPSRSLEAGPLKVWIALFGLAATQSILQIVSHQNRILFAERVHLRLRVLLAYRGILHDAVPPVALSTLNYFGSEIFPRTASLVFHSVQVSCFAIQAAALTAAMLYVAPGDALVSVAALGLCGALVLHLNRLSNRAGAHLPGIHRAYERSKVRIARNWLLIRALRLQAREHLDQVELCSAYYRHTVTAQLFANLGAGLGPMLSVLLLAVVTFAHIRVFREPGPDLIAFLYLLFRFQQMLANGSYLLGGAFAYGQHLRETARFLDESSPDDTRRALAHEHMLDSPLRRTLAAPLDKPGSADSRGSISVGAPRLAARGLSFAWSDGMPPVFCGLDVELPAGDQLGIVGANGTGKSTFLAILLGIFRASQGTVVLDGLDSAEWVSRHRQAVGFVGAEPYVVEGTIRENLQYGLNRPGEPGELWEVLEEVGLARAVRSLPSGLDSRIEEGGEGLSAGEKQKLGVGRALLRRAALLVLDEPTANVDEESERDIVEALRRLKGRCTVVLVSHKPAALLHADRRCDFNSVSSRQLQSADENFDASRAAAED